MITFKPFMKSHSSRTAATAEELPVLFREERKVSVQDLGEDEMRRLHYCSRHHINYISGTMSPADKGRKETSWSR